MSKPTSTTAQLVVTAETTIKPPTFDPGGKVDAVVAPYKTWALVSPGNCLVAPEGAVFSVAPHPVDADVYLVRPAQDGLAMPFGGDLAVVGSEYSLRPYGDGTATLVGIEAAVGTVIYLPGSQFGDDDSPWSIENAGFWQVERIIGGCSLRRVGSGGVGFFQTVKAASARDIQSGMDQEGYALVLGCFPGVWPIVAGSPRWIGLRVPMPLPEVPAVSFRRFVAVQTYLSQFEVQTDQVASLRINGSTSDVVLAPKQPGVDAEMSRFEMTGFVTAIHIENCSGQPMKLRCSYRTGK